MLTFQRGSSNFSHLHHTAVSYALDKYHPFPFLNKRNCFAKSSIILSSNMYHNRLQHNTGYLFSYYS